METYKTITPQYINVNYVIRNQIKLFIGERSKTTFDSGCKIFDLFINEPHQFDIISFQNYYTGYLTIKAKEDKPQSPNQADEWKILVKRQKLMENVHGESGATSTFTLDRENMLNKDISNIYQLRFILQQPSVNWKDFGLNEIKLKLRNPELDLDTVLTEYSAKCTNKILSLDKVPPIEDLSSRLQNLWYLCKEASKQTKSELEDNPKFDIDGCYEIGSLTYSGL